MYMHTNLYVYRCVHVYVQEYYIYICKRNVYVPVIKCICTCKYMCIHLTKCAYIHIYIYIHKCSFIFISTTMWCPQDI